MKTLRKILLKESFDRLKERLASDYIILHSKKTNLKGSLLEHFEDTLLNLLKYKEKKRLTDQLRVIDSDGLYTITKVNKKYEEQLPDEEYNPSIHDPVFTIATSPWKDVIDARIEVANSESISHSEWLNIGVAIVLELTHFGFTEKDIKKEKKKIQSLTMTLNNESS